MRNKITLLVCSFLIISIVKAQEKITDDMRELYSKILYANKEPIFKEDIFQYKTVGYIASDHFHPVPPNRIIEECISNIKNTGEITVTTYSEDSDLYFKALLSENVASYLSKELTLTLKESGLKYINGKPIVLNTISKTALSPGELKLKVRTKENIDASQDILGNITFDLEYLTNYVRVRLSKSDIGQIFNLGSCDFKLIDIFKNKIVLEKLCEEEDDQLDIKVINFTSNGQAIKSYSYLELVKLKHENENINLDSSHIRSMIILYKTIYDIFVAKPEITSEAFDALMTTDLLEGLKDSTKYIILKNVADFESDFILYSPKYGNKEFKMEFD
ncbi:hypothetical protein HCG49_07475 [Arenibacter sp. 6A1]|uniref:hypothetical protein n=1 Tax=Arenibacter sp. 6A1 TaxID=2720391 RepID=UPI0014465EDD|nr:hypothetical protein [Arenibacter sp. 6A1]NKI26399.1 hypothetical protein [Arenibacter sp. 6A1]